MDRERRIRWRVRPLTGARIETRGASYHWRFWLVRPLTGARIETFIMTMDRER